MKAIHYDAEGDILSVTFAEAATGQHTGVELSDNIVFYFDAKTEQPIALILSSYHAMMQVSKTRPLALKNLSDAPLSIQSTVIRLLQQAPISGFLQLTESSPKAAFTSRVPEVFTPAVLQAVAAD